MSNIINTQASHTHRRTARFGTRHGSRCKCRARRPSTADCRRDSCSNSTRRTTPRPGIYLHTSLLIRAYILALMPFSFPDRTNLTVFNEKHWSTSNFLLPLRSSLIECPTCFEIEATEKSGHCVKNCIEKTAF